MDERRKTTASTQATWALVTQGVTSAKVEAHRLRHLVNRGLNLVEKSKHKDHLYQVAGDIIEDAPKKLDAIERALDRVSYALSTLGRKELKNQIPLADRTLVEETLYDVSPFAPTLQRAARGLARALEAYSKIPQEVSGVRTWLDEDSVKGIPRDRDLPDPLPPKAEALPIQDRREKRQIPQPSYRKTDEPVPVRTPGVDGDLYGVPIKYDYESVTRRSMQAQGGPMFDDDYEDELFVEEDDSVAARQKKQRGRSKQKSQQYYRQHKQDIKKKSKKRYQKKKNKPEFKKQQKKRRKSPERFRRRASLSREARVQLLALRYLKALPFELGR